MMIDVDNAVSIKDFKGCKTLRNKINVLEYKLRFRNVQLQDHIDEPEVRGAGTSPLSPT